MFDFAYGLYRILVLVCLILIAITSLIRYSRDLQRLDQGIKDPDKYEFRWISPYAKIAFAFVPGGNLIVLAYLLVEFIAVVIFNKQFSFIDTFEWFGRLLFQPVVLTQEEKRKKAKG